MADSLDTGDAGARRAQRAEEFDASYSGVPPWDIGRPQRAFAEIAEAGVLVGPVLDVGCGTGEHCLMASSHGLDATGVDISPAAIGIAERKAADRGLAARFLVADALDLAALNQQFATVLDCGLFHIFEDGERRLFVDSLRSVMRPGATYHMLCFSDSQPGDWGPRRVSEGEIRASFTDGWRVESIMADTLEITISPEGARAWHVTVTRT